MTTVISVEDLSKQYHLGTLGTGTLSHDLNRWWAHLRGKPDPTVRIGQERHPTSNVQSPTSNLIWALRDVSFEVKQGEVLGIIGRNGAGKSTLLKILSRVTAPTSGEVKVKGRIASLLEVGTGFHPELTGRENIYLNGAILGMSKREIARKFDEIVAFAEVEKFIDTPVKRYSSGMYVRLAFAVAAHLEPEILLVDEVLAVGDAAFQKKCLGKMGDVAKAGRTVLFVSHNMGAILKLVQVCMLLDNGQMILRGEPQSVITNYLERNFERSCEISYAPDEKKDAQILRLAVQNAADKTANVLDPTQPIFIETDFVVRRPINQMGVSIMIDLPDGTPLWHSGTVDAPNMPTAWTPGKHRLQIVFPGNVLNSGHYVVRCGIARSDGTTLDRHLTDGLTFELTEASVIATRGKGMGKGRGLLILVPEYRTYKLNGMKN